MMDFYDNPVVTAWGFADFAWKRCKKAAAPTDRRTRMEL